MKNKFKKFREFIKTFFVIILLLAITFATMELQRQYYNRADEKLLHQVNIENYSINVVNDEMDMSQKIEAMVDENSIISDGNRQFDEELQAYFNDMLVCEVEDMLDYGWRYYLVNVLYDTETQKEWGSVKIVRVIDNQIYSFELGILAFRSEPYQIVYEPGLILFDYATGKILYLGVYCDYIITDVGYSNQYNVEYSYDVESQLYSSEEVTYTQVSFQEALSKYYGMELNPEECDGFVTEVSIWASPFSTEDILGENFDELYKYIYKKFKKMYQY